MASRMLLRPGSFLRNSTMFSSFSKTTPFQVRSYSELREINKILIANRGEIACRVIKTAKKMGIKTVAVYSTADIHSLHVAMADECYHVGPPPSAQSYLNMDAIVHAIKDSGADAVHPGYGFLSENQLFAERLMKENVIFIGPNQGAIAAMGDKIESKKLAADAGVHTIPGFNGVVRDVDHALEIAHDIGYPIMVKASAGGGGKGMRIAWNDSEVAEAFKISKAEAAASFGDDRLLVEKFIDNPRHIEIQVLGDKHGNVVYLNERECSIQRRNQKVIEEAPSSHLDEATRQAMGKQAVQLAKAVNYDSAGTVECLVDSQRNFYFLEMNTRLQVEHPITEYITGVDLVEQMIRVARGEKLQLKQEDIGINGWAFESRVYAEDSTNYMPSIGQLHTYIEPSLTDGEVRVDTGIVEGSEISVHYDPMISKLVTHGPDRHTALEAMKHALDTYVIKGVTHNIPLLREVCSHPRFAKGDISTKFLGEEYPTGFIRRNLNPQELNELLTAGAYVYLRKKQRLTEWADTEDYAGHEEHEVIIKFLDEVYPVKIEHDFQTKVTIGNETFTVDADWAVNSPILTAEINQETKHLLYLDPVGTHGFKLQFLGSQFDLEFLTPREYELSKHMLEKPKLDMSSLVITPMPGTVKAVMVKPGDIVAANQELAVVEAMKMQNFLKSPRTGVISKVHVKEGESVVADEILIEFEKEEKKEEKK